MHQSQFLIIFLFVGFAAVSQGSEQDDSSRRIFLLKRLPISQNIYFGEDPTIDALQNLVGNDLQEKRGLPISMTNDKRAIPMSGGIYGKRSSIPALFGINYDSEGEIETVKRARAALPFSGGIYGKRAMNIPFSGGIYGKRSIALRSIPISGGIYG